MDSNSGLLTTAIQFLGDYLKSRKSFSSYSRPSTSPKPPGRQSSHSVPTTPLMETQPEMPPFHWQLSRTESTDARGESKELSVDVLDALPSPSILKAATTTVPPGYPSRLPVPQTKAPQSLFSNRYFMHHEKRGIAVIINNRVFASALGMPDRKGTDEDARTLTTAFKTLGLDVHQYDNLTAHHMVEAMKYFASLDHSKHDCFFSAILTHGDDGVLYGVDGRITVEKLTAPFKGDRALTLAGKPKLFIFQACRGDRLDYGVNLVQGDDAGVTRLPVEADFLFAYSTIPGFYSWRNTDNGSWYIQALCRLIQLHYGDEEACMKDPRYEPDLDFLRLLTRVSYDVAYLFQSSVPTNPDLDQKKQVPSIVSQLTRDLYFPTKIPASLPLSGKDSGLIDD